MISIDRYAYSSKLAKLDPKAKMFFAFVPLTLCLFLNSAAVSVFIIIVMASAIVKYSDVTIYKFIKFLLIPFTFLFLGVVTILINQFTFDMVLYGLSLILRGLATVSCVYFLSFNTPLITIFQTLEKSFLPKLIVNLMELIYRYIFIVLEEAECIKTAQSSRLGYFGFKSSIACLGTLISELFLRSYQRADRVYSSLESRGYTGTISTLEEEYVNSPLLYVAAGAFSIGIFGVYLWV